MALRSSWFKASFGLVLLAGCEDPKVTMVMMPGVEYKRPRPPNSGSGAEAIGEAGRNLAAATAPLSTNIAEPTPLGETRKTPLGVVYETLKEGAGDMIKPGQTGTLHYVGKLADGKQFDSSRDKGQPIDFLVGVKGGLKGWDEAIPGMKVGEIRRLNIPSDLGYGPSSQQGIPANSVLVFEIELLGVKDAKVPDPTEAMPGSSK